MNQNHQICPAILMKIINSNSDNDKKEFKNNNVKNFNNLFLWKSEDSSKKDRNLYNNIDLNTSFTLDKNLTKEEEYEKEDISKLCIRKIHQKNYLKRKSEWTQINFILLILFG